MLKENMKHAVKLYAASWIAGVAGIFIYLSVISVARTFVKEGQTISGGLSFAMNGIALLIQGILFTVIIYGRIWEIGNKDSNTVAFGHMQKDVFRGLKIGLLASVPSLISFLALIADKTFGLWDGMAAAYRLCQVGLYPIIARAMGPLLTITTDALSWGSIICAGIPLLFVPAVSVLGYILGYRRVAIAERLVFARKKK